MSYHTHFTGRFTLSQPLSIKQLRELEQFSESHHFARPKDGIEYAGRCDWVPTEDGESIVCNSEGSFYAYDAWLKVIIRDFIKPWGLVLNGEVFWNGEEAGDLGKLVVVDNVLTVFVAEIVYVKREKQP